ncbi:peroxiredoxin-like family protein [Aurantiacibacter gangjinensis]|uniref:Alkyl hydroperoxide reductase n=1 Tax=Aurantiacibacter gangjinensis TaxID=502682 RepID=A0A0G9MQA9_9SPHN|nr:peroxiredoxin-like family protein [Aurantiacibacter gangjinensis]APE28767.1 Glutamate synthase [NADPH] large chain [Aurantiacibacter gangjinensis]KLE32922.1 alkyl hydroperoxide reductase [Aurantiacibacter gangjinensis]
MLKPGEQTPDIDLPLTIDARFHLSKQEPEAFTMLVFYRGKHCPICQKQLEELGSRLDEFVQRGINVFAISMDNEERAMVVDEEWDTHDLPLAHSLTEDAAREWGLYISQKREGSEEPDVFSEPGLFLLRPDRSLHMAVVQNMPFSRPSLDQLLEGVDYTVKNDYPTRGTLT